MSNLHKNSVSSFKQKLQNTKTVQLEKLYHLELDSDGSVPSDYLDFEPIAPDESDIAEELGLLGTYIDF